MVRNPPPGALFSSAGADATVVGSSTGYEYNFTDVAVVEDVAVVAAAEYGLLFFDISDPAHPDEFFRIPFDEMSAVHLLINRVRDMNLDNMTVVATGLGFAKRARNFAEMLEAPLAIVESRHAGEGAERQSRRPAPCPPPSPRS